LSQADIGMSGANVVAADTGSLFLIENEGNIRLATGAPPVHIALVGMEICRPFPVLLAGSHELKTGGFVLPALGASPSGRFTALLYATRFKVRTDFTHGIS